MTNVPREQIGKSQRLAPQVQGEQVETIIPVNEVEVALAAATPLSIAHFKKLLGALIGQANHKKDVNDDQLKQQHPKQLSEKMLVIDLHLTYAQSRS